MQNIHVEDMALRQQATETILADREISRLADAFPMAEYFNICDYLEMDRITAMNVNHNAG